MEISLEPLRETPQETKLILAWALSLWGDRYTNYSPDDWANFYSKATTAEYESWTGVGQELVYVAKRDQEVVGTIALVDFDELEEFRHLTPWIAAFIVNPDLRGQGLGSKILSLFESHVAALGIKALHLWTEDQSAFYLKRGYALVSGAKIVDLDIYVMRKELTQI